MPAERRAHLVLSTCAAPGGFFSYIFTESAILECNV